MRKQELIHLHALCARLRRHVETRRDVSADAFSRYDDASVGPAEIHRRKVEHHEALVRLLSDLATVVDGDGAVTDDPVRPGSSR